MPERLTLTILLNSGKRDMRHSVIPLHKERKFSLMENSIFCAVIH